MYAVIMSGGKQYRVSEGDVVRLEKLSEETEASVKFTDVLLLNVFMCMLLVSEIQLICNVQCVLPSNSKFVLSPETQ